MKSMGVSCYILALGKGTSSLGSHMKDNEEDEIKEIEAEFRN